MELTVTISPTAEREFGEGIQLKIQELIEKEAIRLGHIRRSQPKSSLPPVNLEAQRLGERLLEIYARKRARYGQMPFPDALAAQEYGVRKAMEHGFVAQLQTMLDEQPWTKI